MICVSIIKNYDLSQVYNMIYVHIYINIEREREKERGIVFLSIVYVLNCLMFGSG